MAQVLAIFVPVWGAVRKVWVNNHYAEFNAAIGAAVGTIASSIDTPAYGQLDAWIDDEGLLVGARYNPRITEIVNYPYHIPGNHRRLYGDGLILSRNSEGETISLSEDIANNIVAQYNNALWKELTTR